MHTKVTCCNDCPCFSDCCTPCCGANTELLFDYTDTKGNVHQQCPLRTGGILIELDQLTPAVGKTIKGVIVQDGTITTIRGHDLDGNPVIETYEGPVSPMPFSSIDEIKCYKGVPGCKCAVGFQPGEQCPDCREDKVRSSRCVCPPPPCHHLYELGSPGCLLCGAGR